MSYFTRPEKPANQPTIVVLCGSIRFSHAFREANLRETLAGRIVLSIGCDMRSDADLFADLSEDAIAKIKADLDELHKRKIDLADEVLVLNVGGYVGDSTRSEIDYAERLGKPIRWLSDESDAEASSVSAQASGVRADIYRGQNNSPRLTPAQRRRAAKKDNRLYRPDPAAVAALTNPKGQQ